MKKEPNGYAPDLFSEHALAAQLGLRVVSILTRARWLGGNSAASMYFGAQRYGGALPPTLERALLEEQQNACADILSACAELGLIDSKTGART